MHLAACAGQVAAIQLLLEAGASVNAKDEDDKTPLAYAAKEGRAEAARALLRAEGIEIDTPDSEGCTPLITAAANKHAEVVRLLVEAGGRVGSCHARCCCSTWSLSILWLMLWSSHLAFKAPS